MFRVPAMANVQSIRSNCRLSQITMNDELCGRVDARHEQETDIEALPWSVEIELVTENLEMHVIYEFFVDIRFTHVEHLSETLGVEW